MSHKVFANGNEIASRSSSGKSSAAFPDVCFTAPRLPPQLPEGTPIPYPNTCKAKDIRKGSKTVVIKKKEIALEGDSYFKSSSGDGTATKGAGKGIITKKIEGKCYFQNWSQNVKVESKGVCRNMDLVTHNHDSQPPNTPPITFNSASASNGDKCDKEKEKEKIDDACGPEDPNDPTAWMANCEGLNIKPNSEQSSKGHIERAKKMLKKLEKEQKPIKEINKKKEAIKEMQNKLKKLQKRQEEFTAETSAEKQKAHAKDMTEKAKKNSCINARKCELVPYEETDSKNAKNGKGCCPGQTGHHVMPHSMFEHKDGAGCSAYSDKEQKDVSHAGAPNICVEGANQHHGSHGEVHDALDDLMDEYKNENNDITTISYEEAKNLCATSIEEIAPHCNKECIKEQLDKYYDKCKEATLHAKSGK